ncbi:MAG: tRNA (N(6)-L-threonylcarbamoyladenosine(37)-C(2))-methylthiotransferase MtaB [Clostridia bacterium]|nr:tRNA (N(6)-L-threonylcarbamoyladenosine(37)-C(2))-methylthiotransferase MtaB [Clostridia bacterium]
MNVAFYTLGCKVNQYETESMREQLQNAGYKCDSAVEEADIVIINSCTVTAESDRKTRQAVRRFRRMLPNAVIVLCGCVPAAFPDIDLQLPEADIIISNSGEGTLCSLLDRYFAEGKKISAVMPHEKGETYKTPSITSFSERTRAFVKIEDGCDRFCSYCIIPFARGRVRSRSIDSIRSEIESLARGGFKEIVLVGINLSAYGKGEEIDLCDTVSAVSAVEGIERVRLGSLEPDHISDSMLLRLKAEPKFCPQFHLSLQSGCDATLKRMNRHYDSAFYRDLVSRIRAIFPDAAITTDIMVGFAGETDEEFSQSLAFAKEIGFAKAHIFCYSRRKGTVADKLPSQIENALKTKRSHILADACEQSEIDFLENQLGRVFPVLFETEENGFCFGYTPNYTRVKIPATEGLCGNISDVLLNSVVDGCCLGQLVK